MGANEPVAPASLLQVAGTGRIVREKSLELWQRLWEPKIATLVNVHEHGRTLPLVAVGDNRIGKPRSSRYGTNGDDTGWVRFKPPIVTVPGQIEVAVDKLAVLVLQRLQFARIGNVHAAIFGTPFVKGRIADAVLAAQIGCRQPRRCSFSALMIWSSENLLRRMSVSSENGL